MADGIRILKPIAQLRCPPEATTRDVLERLNRSPGRFQIVVDDHGKLLGTVTDGDVRRNLLAGGTLETPVTEYMNKSPAVGRPGRDVDNRALVGRWHFVPVLDDSGTLLHVLVRASDVARIGRALIMAGGFGKRLGERTQSCPKPMLAVGDRPMLEHVLQLIEAANVDVIYIAVHYLREQIENYIASRPNKCQIEFLVEDEPLGTAGILGRLRDLDVPLLVVNADVMTRTDLLALQSFHFAHGHDGTVGVANYQVDVPFGVVRHDDKGLFRMIEEKPKLNFFVAAGIYYLSPQILALAPTSGPMDMPELLTQAHDVGLKIGLFPIHEYWLDVGRPADLQAAHLEHSVAASIS